MNSSHLGTSSSLLAQLVSYTTLSRSVLLALLPAPLTPRPDPVDPAARDGDEPVGLDPVTRRHRGEVGVDPGAARVVLLARLPAPLTPRPDPRSEEHTYELQSLRHLV